MNMKNIFGEKHCNGLKPVGYNSDLKTHKFRLVLCSTSMRMGCL